MTSGHPPLEGRPGRKRAKPPPSFGLLCDLCLCVCVDLSTHVHSPAMVSYFAQHQGCETEALTPNSFWLKLASAEILLPDGSEADDGRLELLCRASPGAPPSCLVRRGARAT